LRLSSLQIAKLLGLRGRRSPGADHGQADAALQAAWDESRASLASVPPTRTQRTAAAAACVCVLLAFGAVTPFALVPLPRIDGYVPAVYALIAGTNLLTAVLLFGQYAVARSRALWVLATGYLFGAVIVAVATLTFPGAFGATGLLGSSASTTAWLWAAWRYGFIFAVAGYALLKTQDPASDAPRLAPVSAVGWSVAGVIAVVGALTWSLVAWDASLPTLAVSETRFSATANVVMLANLLICLGVLALLWARRSSVLDWWLMVAVCASSAEAALIAFVAASRYTLSFYASKAFALLVASAVLVALVWEIVQSYTRLWRAVVALQRERATKLMNLEVMLGAVSHEIRQPLTAIVLNAAATQHLLKREPPDVGKLRENAEDMSRDSLRISEVFESIRGLFKSRDQERQQVDVNALLLVSLDLLSADLKDHEIRVITDLAPDLPPVLGHGGQLQEVFVNIVRNAIDAMRAVGDRARTLRIATLQRDRSRIAIVLEDSGCGIEPQRLADLFDAFVTTKADGMGLGLGICRMIVDRHHGQLAVSSRLGEGARFEVTLPVGATMPPAQPSSLTSSARAEA
jgi:signal transduction histidine kinase